jgi:putative flippase GtrA
MRYALVTTVAQGTSYAVFAVLVLTVLAWLPQAAIVAGAAVGALISYNGHRLFAFAPRLRGASDRSAGSSGLVRP